MRGHSHFIATLMVVIVLIGHGVTGGRIASAQSQRHPGAFMLISGASMAYGMHGPQGATHFDATCAFPKKDATGWGGWPCVTLLKLRTIAPKIRIKNLANADIEDSCRYLTGSNCVEAPGLNPPAAVPQEKMVLSFLRQHRGRVSPILTDLTGNEFSELGVLYRQYFSKLTATVPQSVVARYRTRMHAALVRYRRNTNLMLTHIRQVAPRADLIFVPPYLGTDYLKLKMSPSVLQLFSIWTQTQNEVTSYRTAAGLRFHALALNRGELLRAEWKVEGLTQNQWTEALSAEGGHMNDLWHLVYGTAIWKAYRSYLTAKT